MLAARLVAPSMTLSPVRTASWSWDCSSRCTWPRMIMSGLLISCATPPASSPTAASRSARTTSVWERRSSSSCRRVSVYRRALSSARPIWSALDSSSATSSLVKRSSVCRPSESVPRMRWRARIGTHRKPRMPSAVTAARAAGRRSSARPASSTRRTRPGGGHPADEALADRQHLVDLAQAIREAALAAQQEHLAVGGDEVKARDLVAGDVGEGAQRLLDDLVEIERAAHRLGHRAENLQVTDQRRRAA